MPHPQAPEPPSGRAHPIATLATVLAILLTLTVFGQLAAARALANRSDIFDDLRRVNSLDEQTV